MIEKIFSNLNKKSVSWIGFSHGNLLALICVWRTGPVSKTTAESMSIDYYIQKRSLLHCSFPTQTNRSHTLFVWCPREWLFDAHQIFKASCCTLQWKFDFQVVKHSDREEQKLYLTKCRVAISVLFEEAHEPGKERHIRMRRNSHFRGNWPCQKMNVRNAILNMVAKILYELNSYLCFGRITLFMMTMELLAVSIDSCTWNNSDFHTVFYSLNWSASMLLLFLLEKEDITHSHLTRCTCLSDSVL